MQVEILETEEQPIYNRKRLVTSIAFQGKVPSRHEVAMAIAKKTESKEDQVSVRMIRASYGAQKARVELFIYDNNNALSANEPAYYAKRTLKTMPKKEEEKSAEGA